MIKQHTHTYVRMSKDTFKCDDPKCTHFAHRALVLGKESICAVCHDQVIILDKNSLRRARPRCIQCSNTDEAKKIRERASILKGLGFDTEKIDNVKES